MNNEVSSVATLHSHYSAPAAGAGTGPGRAGSRRAGLREGVARDPILGKFGSDPMDGLLQVRGSVKSFLL